MAYYGANSARYYSTPDYLYPEEVDYYAEEGAAAAPGAGAQVGGLLGQVGGLAAGSKLAGLMSGAPAASAAPAAAAVPEGMFAAGTAMDGSTMLLPINGGMTSAASATPGAFSLSGIGSAGNMILPAAGALGLGDVLLNDRGAKRGGLQGAASGAAIGSTFGPQGALIGAGIGGLVGLGKGLLGGKPKTNKEQDRWKSLGALGYSVPAGYDDPSKKRYVAKGQLFDPSLGADFVGNNPKDGGWVNNKFSQSRDEKDLVGKDLIGYASFAEKFGKDWLDKYSLDQKDKIAQKALDLGLVDEHHGTIDVKWNPEIEEYAKTIIAPPAPAVNNRRR